MKKRVHINTALLLVPAAGLAGALVCGQCGQWWLAGLIALVCVPLIVAGARGSRVHWVEARTDARRALTAIERQGYYAGE